MPGEARNRTEGGEVGTGPIYKLRNNKRRILGPDWPMSEVVTPPPHNSEKTHGLLESINNNDKI